MKGGVFFPPPSTLPLPTPSLTRSFLYCEMCTRAKKTKNVFQVDICEAPGIDDAAKIQKVSKTYLRENDKPIENVLKLKSSNLRNFMINNLLRIFLLDFNQNF
jgi:hypothetical protein